MRATPLELARAALGLADALATARVGEVEFGRRPTADELAVLRFLGWRQVTQASITALVGGRRLGVVVDALHAASMIALAIWGPATIRRAAVSESVIAGALAIWGGSILRRR
ncbi:hypothetical protein [Naasia lichenicola]|uniref:Uncharacterized protein n=1 Tax=Naasia lichenicola TaxID=2565933 RepID=A0A4S4FKT7_9MICO|nr:hypothetical protein [Naasia lichenicola]THG29915.1 hypothetical protein E6C64_14810 [Naasia lichenicola]